MIFIGLGVYTPFQHSFRRRQIDPEEMRLNARNSSRLAATQDMMRMMLAAFDPTMNKKATGTRYQLGGRRCSESDVRSRPVPLRRLLKEEELEAQASMQQAYHGIS